MIISRDKLLLQRSCTGTRLVVVGGFCVDSRFPGRQDPCNRRKSYRSRGTRERIKSVAGQTDIVGGKMLSGHLGRRGHPVVVVLSIMAADK